MKFLKLCLWCCIALFGVSAVCAQTSAPDQERQMTEALRKALDQSQPSFDAKARAKQAEMEKLLVQERNAAEAQRRSETSRVNGEAAGTIADAQARHEAENRAKADMKAKAEAEARRMVEQQRITASQAAAASALSANQEAAARAALRTQNERTDVNDPAASRVSDRIPAATPLPAESANASAVIQTPVPRGESQLPPDQESAAREALRKSLEQPAAPVPSAKPSPNSDVDASKLARDRARAEAESQARAKREADRIIAERTRRSEEISRSPTPALGTPAPAAATSSDDAAVREALRRALEGAEKTPAPAKPPVQPPPAESSKPAPSAVAPPPPSVAPAEPARPVQTPPAPAIPAPAEALSNADDAALREALRKTMEEGEAAGAAIATSQSSKAQTERRAKQETKAEPRATASEQRSKESTTPTAISPAAPKSKAQRLAELTEAYRRDEITPAQYHQERAKILAEPNDKP
jgi:hypothetical protein